MLSLTRKIGFLVYFLFEKAVSGAHNMLRRVWQFFISSLALS
jgi:hypothetical protein